MLKTCLDCKTEKPEGEFYLQAAARAKGTNWRLSYCKVCMGLRGKKRVASLTPEQKATALARRRENWTPITDAIERAREKARHLAWRNANREHVRLTSRLIGNRHRAKYPARQKRYGADEWADTMAAFGHRCGYCGSAGKMTVEHVTPVCKGGLTEPDNIIPACMPCNMKKGPRGILSMVNVVYQGGM